MLGASFSLPVFAAMLCWIQQQQGGGYLFTNSAGLLWGSALPVPAFPPPVWLWFCTCWAQSFPTCASNPGSIRATVRVQMSYCTSRRGCQHAAAALRRRRRQQKAISAQPASSTKARSRPKSGWNVGTGCHPCVLLTYERAGEQAAAANHKHPSAQSLLFWGPFGRGVSGACLQSCFPEGLQWALQLYL